jgi:hypothetical protein
VLTDLHGVTGRDIMDHLIAGDRDPAVLARLARRRARAKIPELVAFAGWMAQQESKRRSDRIKTGLNRCRAQGKPVGRQPGAADKKPRKRAGYVASWEADPAAQPTTPGQHGKKRRHSDAPETSSYPALYPCDTDPSRGSPARSAGLKVLRYELT